MTMEYECGSLKRNSSVAPFSLFISFSIFFIFLWPHCLFLFIFHLSSWDLFFCPLLGSFDLSSLRSFPHFTGNTLYFTRSIEDISNFTRSTQHKLNINYHDLCKCMPLPV